MDRLYIATGFVWLVAGMAAGLVLGASGHPEYGNAHAHAALLGFVLPVLFGLLWRAYPVLARSRLALGQFALYQAGALALVAGKVAIDGGGSSPLAPLGALALIAAVLWFGAMFAAAQLRAPALAVAS